MSSIEWIIGVDPSTSGTGLVLVDRATFAVVRRKTVRGGPARDGMVTRLRRIHAAVAETLTAWRAAQTYPTNGLVVVEDPRDFVSFKGSAQRSLKIQMTLGMSCGAVALALPRTIPTLLIGERTWYPKERGRPMRKEYAQTILRRVAHQSHAEAVALPLLTDDEIMAYGVAHYAARCADRAGWPAVVAEYGA